MIPLLTLLSTDPASAAEPPATPAETLVTATLVIAVPDAEEAAEAIIERAEAAGGWFQLLQPQMVSVRVPRDAIDEVLADIEELGLVLDESLDRRDATRELADLRGKVAVREKVLKTYREVLERAGPDAILVVESQITSAIVEIETLRGQITMLESQAAQARLDVAFRFVQRDAPVRDGRSSFGWLNTLNLDEVRASTLDAKVTHGRRLDVPKPPEGFSAWDDKRGYRAISADGVVYRVRRIEDQPEAELAFWRDAARERMVAAGYKVLGEGLLEGRDDGAWLDVAAPIGDQDWGYLFAFFPQGEDIVVAEAVGEVRALDARKDALLAAMADLRP